MKYTVKNLSKTEVEFEIEVLAEDFNKFIDQTIEALGKDIEVKGFRKGKAPKNIIEEHFGSEKILVEAADHAVSHAYRDAVLESKIQAVLKPEVEIKKMAKGDSLIFTAKTCILPDIELPDYKEISSKIKRNKVEVKEEDIQKTLDWLQKSRSKLSLKNDSAKNGDFVQIEYAINNNVQKDGFILGQGHFLLGFEDKLIDMKAGDEKEIELDVPEQGKIKIKTKLISVNNMELPEINDEFAQSLGKFQNLESLKNNIKEGIAEEKEQVETQRIRNEVLDQIIKKVKIELPAPLVEQEKNQMLESLKQQISQRMQLSFEDYLKKAKKSEQDVLKPLEQEAERKLKVFIVLRKIGEKENIQVSGEEVLDEVNKTLKQYPSIEEAEKGIGIDLESFKDYTKEVIRNEKIFKTICS
jgi:trigger factor